MSDRADSQVIGTVAEFSRAQCLNHGQQDGRVPLVADNHVEILKKMDAITSLLAILVEKIDKNRMSQYSEILETPTGEKSGQKSKDAPEGSDHQALIDLDETEPPTQEPWTRGKFIHSQDPFTSDEIDDPVGKIVKETLAALNIDLGKNGDNK
ncbi:hypothetical protein JCGZ_20142 [Jatropha curcas]|uniref:Uncharacterized protein n=1 Tax=Jatropha curcas TaxID=180498 RepID=A0A067JUD1_JATCU|nr:hypothetical protein JCGZ_20142 [Jatropha curcas]